MKKFKLIMLRWKMGIKCVWWLFKYRNENVVTAKVYLCSLFQAPHLGEVHYIIDDSIGACYQSKHTNVKDRFKTIFKPTCYQMHKSKKYLLNGPHDQLLKISPFSFVGMPAGMSLTNMKKFYKGHNIQFLYTTVVRL